MPKSYHLALGMLMLVLLLSLSLTGCGGNQGSSGVSPNLHAGIPLPDVNQPDNVMEFTRAGSPYTTLRYGWNAITFPQVGPKSIRQLILSYRGELKDLYDASGWGWVYEPFLYYKRVWLEAYTNYTDFYFQPGTRYWFWCNSKGTVLYFNKPYLSNINPASGAVGGNVSLMGVNFGLTPNGSTVNFTGAQAQVLAWSDSSVVCAVPLGATSGPVTLTIRGETTTALEFLLYDVYIDFATPNFGAEGSVVTINGVGFGAVSGSVDFNGTSAEIISSWNPTCIVCAVPSGAASGDLTVSRAGKTSNAVPFTVGSPWIQINPPLTGNELQKVWGTSSRDRNGVDIFAVGDLGTILHYDGAVWTKHPCPSIAKLYDVWGSSGSDVYAVGDGGTILHYNGTSWQQVSSGTHNDLRGIWGSSAGNIYAVGFNGTMLRYNGNTWNAANSGTNYYLWGIWGTSSNNIFASGGHGTVLHYNGSNWSPMTMPSDNDFLRVSGSSGNDVYVSSWGSHLYHYNGSTWDNICPPTYQVLWDVAATAPSNVFAASINGEMWHFDGSSWTMMATGSKMSFNGLWASPQGDIITAGTSAQVYAYNGSAWSNLRPFDVTSFYSIWGSSANDIFVSGAIRDGGSGIVHFNGSTWSAMNPGTGAEFLYRVRGFAANDVYALGPSGVIMHYDGSGWTQQGYDGWQWHRYGIWGLSPGNVFVVGYRGTILHGPGYWSWIESPTRSILYDIWGSGPNDIHAVGDSARAIHFNGTNWTVVDSHAYSSLNSITGFAPDEVFAVGDYFSVIHYNGTAWSVMDYPRVSDYDQFYGVWGTAANSVYACGAGNNQGIIMHYNGSTWKQLNPLVSGPIREIWGSSESNIYAVGYGGMILKKP